ncbi:butyrophilin-like protein 3 isoform X2 [Tupaia chinensis]|uniref:butyrophilin-like protein 3 isoform X2 n=1 Tax=Tupaia chinensis TaxID=246437 RepID=UPI0007040C5B|nr:butyrophilin-like protein 3 isoform X2 [Tupaia chinensis]
MVVVLMLALALLQLASGQWHVIGPENTVQVLVGEDAVFPCALSPETNAEAMEVRFFRERFSAVVHLYQGGKDLEHMQLPAYRGRSELVKDFKDGRVTLVLKKVTTADAGLYGCSFSSQTYEQEALWELQVSEMGSTPLISLMGFVDGGIQLLCQSSGWLSQPIVRWENSQGHDLPAHSKMNEDMHGLVDVETSVIIQEGSGSVSCSIQLTQQSPAVRSRVLVGETLFQPSTWRLASILLILLCSGACAGLIGMKLSFSKSQEWREMHRESEWREARKHAVEVTLDPDTAHPQFHISNLRAMCYRNVPQDVPQTEKRFTRKCVVATQAFQTGKHYWEVDVGCNEYWYLGVCWDDVDRRGKYVTLSPSNGYWVLGLRADQNYFTINPSIINLSPKTPPRRVGIFLDYEGGAISFFNVNDESLIYTLTHPFHGLLRPYLEHQTYEGENPHPISICPVSLR